MDKDKAFPEKGLFITGTDTDVGKTMISAGIIRFLQQSGLDAAGVKPVCCGSREDLILLQEANASKGSAPLPEEVLNLLYLDLPAAPLSITREIPPLTETLSPYQNLEKEFLIVEGAGGWKVPVSEEWDMESVAVALGYPVILTVSNKLGCLNHALLTAQAIKQASLPLHGFFLNTLVKEEDSYAQETNRDILRELLPCPFLGEIPLGGGTVSAAPLIKSLKIPLPVDLPLQFSPASA